MEEKDLIRKIGITSRYALNKNKRLSRNIPKLADEKEKDTSAQTLVGMLRRKK